MLLNHTKLHSYSGSLIPPESYGDLIYEILPESYETEAPDTSEGQIVAEQAVRTLCSLTKRGIMNNGPVCVHAQKIWNWRLNWVTLPQNCMRFGKFGYEFFLYS